jgi:hypothetical protein
MSELEDIIASELVDGMTELVELDMRGGGGGGIEFNFGGSARVQSVRLLILFTPSKLNRTYARA